MQYLAWKQLEFLTFMCGLLNYFVIQAHAAVLYGFKFWKQYFFVLGSAFIMLDFCSLNTSTVLETKA